MLTARTIKTLEKAGATVTRDECGRYMARFGTWIVQFIDQAGDVHCLRARRCTDLDESQSDYCAGSWFDAIRPCIEFAKRMAEEDRTGTNRRPGWVCPSVAA